MSRVAKEGKKKKVCETFHFFHFFFVVIAINVENKPRSESVLGFRTR